MTKVAILASHNGSGFNALYKASLEKKLAVEIVLLISNNSKSPALSNAKKYGVPSKLINAKTELNPDKSIYESLVASGCGYVFLSGYMKKLSLEVTKNFKVINSHPSLLPKYGGVGMYGAFVHEAVIKNREKVSGVTIHEVNEVYDDGKIILQKEITLASDETVQTLEEKIKKIEAQAIVEAFSICLK